MNRSIREHTAVLSRQLEDHRAALERQSHEFGLYATSRHAAYAELHKRLLTAQTSLSRLIERRPLPDYSGASPDAIYAEIEARRFPVHFIQLIRDHVDAGRLHEATEVLRDAVADSEVRAALASVATAWDYYASVRERDEVIPQVRVEEVAPGAADASERVRCPLRGGISLTLPLFEYA